MDTPNPRRKKQQIALQVIGPASCRRGGKKEHQADPSSPSTAHYVPPTTHYPLPTDHPTQCKWKWVQTPIRMTCGAAVDVDGNDFIKDLNFKFTFMFISAKTKQLLSKVALKMRI